MSQEATVVIFTFWTAFFTAVSVKDLFRIKNDPVAHRLNRFNRLDKADALKLQGQDLREERIRINQAVKEKLIKAGLRRKSDIEKFILLQRVCYVIPLVILAASFFFLRTTIETAVLVSVAFAIIFVIIPRVWLLHAIFKRRKEIKRYLPDTLDLFVVALEAGLSFDGALVRIAEEQRRISTHISREFLYTNQEILVGKTREQALKGLAERCGVDEIDSLVRSVIQSNKLGTSLVKTLRVQSDALRKKRKQDIHAQILKAPVKLIFPLLLFIFPTLVIIILGPSMVQIFRHLGTSGKAF